MVINSQQRIRIAAAPLERFLGEVQDMLRIPEGAVTVCLVPGQRIARWNREYRGKAKATDVLSFPVNGEPGESSKAKANAKDFYGGADPEVACKSPRATSAHGAPKGTPKAKARAEANYLGDIAICPAVAQRNAREFKRPLDAELRILILHGILHLLGYDHEKDTGQMERREKKLRGRLGLA